ncbi:MAG TPA: hypothetical protein PLG15_00540 [Candidatus Gastranaerophilaceae bacterium]|nr:hypothetical protein [Candidatus Gastranaerophilaceae bacterium]
MKVFFNGFFTKVSVLTRKMVGSVQSDLVRSPNQDVFQQGLKGFSKEIGVAKKALGKRKFSDTDSFEIYDRLRMENVGVLNKLIKEKGQNGQKYRFSIEDLKEMAKVEPSKSLRLEELADAVKAGKEKRFSAQQIITFAKLDDVEYSRVQSLMDFKNLSGEDLILLAKQDLAPQKIESLKVAQEALANKLTSESVRNCLTEESINMQELLPGIKRYYEASNGLIEKILIRKDGKFNRAEYYYPNENIEKVLLDKGGNILTHAQI